ncbi:malonyl-ACP O-methyltransferase BioC [Heliorestis acidaminivorans]|uniref:Malonyl-[acyl-carrier protein] O-methyltransferase n=1 Tax=Heliorestis acidaminivorans TaxID=553427 RepID=A0A6I0ET14_9FIRM|nr:malonyl-ACP O-methyltransferase BioC [Heliorestis acidaminivorans]KAB2952121.1 malonyl-ACP O-methyltransferase BioC [Heliorestis acidaminivorans]
MIDKKVLRHNFSKNAINYDRYAKVQKAMAHELLKSLSSFRSLEKLNILDIGCGTGYLTEQLLELYPQAQITALDIAPGMIEYAQQKLPNENIEFLCADIEEVALNKKFDLIISNATFQWFNQLEATLRKLDSLLKDNAILTFSTFGSHTFQELHHAYAIAKEKLQISSAILPGQKFISTAELKALCQENFKNNDSSRYTISAIEQQEYEYFDTVRDFLKSVKKVGASNSNCERLINPSLIKEMMKTYEATFTIDNKTRATYHCLYLTITKESPGLPKLYK